MKITKMLDEMAVNVNSAVREMVAIHPRTSLISLVKLLGDVDEKVREHAEAQIKNRMKVGE